MGQLIWSRVLGVLAAAGATAVVSLVWALGAGAAAPCGSNGVFSSSGSTDTCTYTTVGEDTFEAPTGVESLGVTAVGAAGGTSEYSPESPGGEGAEVSGQLTVAAGTLYVEVGGVGGTEGQPGFNGGGSSFYGGGGGGASDVRAVPRADTETTLASRLIVAAGGGGSGTNSPRCRLNGGGDGGNAESAGGAGLNCGSPPGTGGGAGTSEHGGAAGLPNEEVTAGSLGVGGSSYTGGGGGGGLYGGGGGGDSSLIFNESGELVGAGGAGGGGGGSDLIPAGGTSGLATGPAQVAISWTVRAGPPSVTLTTPANEAGYTYGQVVDAEYSCAAGTDATLKSCVGAVADGSPISTSTVGSGQTFPVTATDTDGQSTTVTHTYTVTPAVTSLVAAPQVDLPVPKDGVGLDVVSATLSAGGSPLAGQTVTFTVGKLSLCSAVTNAQGVARCEIAPLKEVAVLLANTYTASFTGTSDYLGSVASTRAVIL